jgi:hypothetical protein
LIEPCAQRRNVFYGSGEGWIDEREWEEAHPNVFWMACCEGGNGPEVVDLAYDIDCGEFWERLLGGGYMKLLEWEGSVRDKVYIQVRVEGGDRQEVRLVEIVEMNKELFGQCWNVCQKKEAASEAGKKSEKKCLRRSPKQRSAM